MPNLSDQLAHALTDHDIDLLRVAASANRRVQQFLTLLQDEIAGRLKQANLSASATARLTAVLRDVRELIASGYGGIDAYMANRIAELIPAEAQMLASTVNKTFGLSVMDGLLPGATLRELYKDTMIMGAPSSQWWLRQAQGLTFKFVQAIRMGMAQGETNDDLIRRVRALDGLFQGPRYQAEALVRTSVQTVANAARVATLQVNSDVVAGVQQLSTLDGRTTPTCIAYDGATWDLNGKPIRGTTLPFINDGGSFEGVPRHWNCRSTLVPVLKTWRDMGIPLDEFTPTMRASADGEVAANLTYDTWLLAKTSAQQDELLGPGRADLFRQGRITARNLVDGATGRPMTLEALRSKHGME